MARRSPAVKRGMAAVVGTGVIAGFLLASGAAAPLISDAVSLLSSTSPTPAAAATSLKVRTVSDSDWMADDQRPEWSSSRGVPSGPSRAAGTAAQAPSAPDAPSIQVPENPKGRTSFNSGATSMRRYTLEPRHSCFQQRGPQRSVEHFSAVAGTGTATVTWFDLGDPDTVSYQVDAVAVSSFGQQVTKIVPAPGTCKDVSYTFTGLRKGVSYVFWLTASNKSPEQDGKAYRAGRGVSAAVVIQ